MPHLNFIKEGSGPVVMFSHSLGSNLAMWDGVAALLKDRYTVLRYDARGHGKSPGTAEAFTMDALADDAAGLIEQQGGGPVHFVGLSMGGMAAQSLAARYPRLVKSVVIANSSSYYDDAAKAMWKARVETVKAKGMSAIAEPTMQRWFTPEFRTGQTQAIAGHRAVLEAINPDFYCGSCMAVGGIDFRQSNKLIACPTLVIAGLRDEATPPAMSQAIADSIPGARLRNIDAAHLSASELPAEFAALVSDFLGKP